MSVCGWSATGEGRKVKTSLGVNICGGPFPIQEERGLTMKVPSGEEGDFAREAEKKKRTEDVLKAAFFFMNDMPTTVNDKQAMDMLAHAQTMFLEKGGKKSLDNIALYVKLLMQMIPDLLQATGRKPEDFSHKGVTKWEAPPRGQ